MLHTCVCGRYEETINFCFVHGKHYLVLVQCVVDILMTFGVPDACIAHAHA